MCFCVSFAIYFVSMARDWPSFDHVNTAPSQCGFTPTIMEAIFQKFCGRNTPIRKRRALFTTLAYAKQYPTVRVQANRPNGCRNGYGFELTKINANFKYLASVVNELEEPVRRRMKQHNIIPRVFFSLCNWQRRHLPLASSALKGVHEAASFIPREIQVPCAQIPSRD